MKTAEVEVFVMVDADGDYRVRGPQLPASLQFRVAPIASAVARLSLNFATTADWPTSATLASGQQTLSLLNATSRELVVRVERTAARNDALFASQAVSLPMFRRLFPSEVFSTDCPPVVTQMTFLVTSATARQTENAQWPHVLQNHLQRLHELVQSVGGTWVKISGDGAMIAFSDPLNAVTAALRLSETLSSDVTGEFEVRAAVTCGTAWMCTINGQLDYLGPAVARAMRECRHAEPGAVLVDQRVADDPHVRERLGLLNYSVILAEE